MKAAKKILVTLFTLVLVTVYSSGVTVFASEADQTKNEGTQVTSENSTSTETDADLLNDDAASTDTTDSNDNSEQDQANDDVFIDDQGQIHDNGEIVDEQGNVLTPDENVTDTDDVSEEDDDADVTDDNSSKSSDKDKKDSKDKEKDKASEKPAYAEKDLRLLSALIYAEAGHQPYEGQLGVANVVLNRLDSNAFWHVHNIKEVIYDRKWSVQFAVTVKNKSGISAMDRALKCYDNDPKSMQKSIKAAKAALEGENNIGNFLCFQNKRYASSIKKKYPNYKIIGDHIFYRSK